MGRECDGEGAGEQHGECMYVEGKTGSGREGVREQHRKYNG